MTDQSDRADAFRGKLRHGSSSCSSTAEMRLRTSEQWEFDSVRASINGGQRRLQATIITPNTPIRRFKIGKCAAFGDTRVRFTAAGRCRILRVRDAEG
jgi:hypothetical protein